ncbi:hypothetical protein [Streptomyces sp. HNM0574]|uniref:hypothetical protein n=1 Tax=Streptomyces sp. HNM0574 TaxID=2714954 RepID=UPI00146EBD35|nr:hypothetical protein [Streptomyces sp. HNM0574]NLU66557.1 hypothetical protein [Streptomyces sp. HNM0574]
MPHDQHPQRTTGSAGTAVEEGDVMRERAWEPGTDPASGGPLSAGSPEGPLPVGEQPGAEDELIRDGDGVRLSVGMHLADLAERLDPDTFTLFLKIMGGLGRAFAQRNQQVDVEMTPAERALYTPELQRELVRLLEKAGVPAEHVVSDLAVAGSDGERPPDRARRSRA